MGTYDVIIYLEVDPTLITRVNLQRQRTTPLHLLNPISHLLHHIPKLPLRPRIHLFIRPPPQPSPRIPHIPHQLPHKPPLPHLHQRPQHNPQAPPPRRFALVRDPPQEKQHALHRLHARVPFDHALVELAVEDGFLDADALPERFDGGEVGRVDGEVVRHEDGVDVRARFDALFRHMIQHRPRGLIVVSRVFGGEEAVEDGAVGFLVDGDLLGGHGVEDAEDGLLLFLRGEEGEGAVFVGHVAVEEDAVGGFVFGAVVLAHEGEDVVDSLGVAVANGGAEENVEDVGCEGKGVGGSEVEKRKALVMAFDCCEGGYGGHHGC